MSVHSGDIAIPSNPVVLLADGTSPPPQPERGPAYPPNIWRSIEQGQTWAAVHILDLLGDHPYKEPPGLEATHAAIAGADAQRAEDPRYERRGLDSFATIFNTSSELAAQEFAGKSVLDIGSGAGVLSNDLRSRAGAAHVTEIDFSITALRGRSGARIAANGSALSVADQAADRTISMFSSTVFTETVDSRLRAICESIRVTKEGGRVFLAPLLGGMLLRHTRWFALQQSLMGGATPPDIRRQASMLQMQQQAAMDIAAVGMVRGLMAEGLISLTPTLKIDEKPEGHYDAISAMLDVHGPLPAQRIPEIIAPYVAQFAL